ncbi:MAG: 6-bladed beta-propeller [Symbiobacteriia bacterium]
MKIKFSTVILVLVGIWVAGSLTFAALYLSRRAPSGIEAIAAAPRLVANQPPTFFGNLKVPPDAALSGPLAVSVAEDGRIYVADSGNSQIKVFSRDGQYLSSFAKRGSGQGELEYPSGLKVKGGRVYVADFKNGRVAVFSTEGQFILNLTHGRGNEPLAPLAVDLDGDGTVHIADRSHRIIVLDAQGRFVRSFGRGGQEGGEFAYPNSILVTQNRTYVADSGNGRVEVFDLTGKYLTQLGGFVNPRGLALDGQGRLHVVDTLAHTVTVFSREGIRLFSFGKRGTEGGEFNFPNGVAIDGSGRILVADRENDRITVWHY